MFFRIMLAGFALGLAAIAPCGSDAVAADRAVIGERVVVQRKAVRHALPAGLPRARYRYVTTITDGPIPYDARPFAYGRYPFAPYTNSYGIPTAVIVDPVDPAVLWRPLPEPTPYSCLFYADC